mmetsp:Transcript_7402/g.27649  ORF Transcript_7402/g.27649 Transcript_7402/m.27649 type:complete len:90 (+) Transcript_7402:2341-2610(+)
MFHTHNKKGRGPIFQKRRARSFERMQLDDTCVGDECLDYSRGSGRLAQRLAPNSNNQPKLMIRRSTSIEICVHEEESCTTCILQVLFLL